MTPKEQNIAIAEACGWKYVPSHDAMGNGGPDWYNGNETVWDETGLPDFCNDLNACHEMEKVLDRKQIYDYAIQLIDVTQAEWMDDPYEVFVVAHATAAQRCEAFLRTLGLLKESK